MIDRPEARGKAIIFLKEDIYYLELEDFWVAHGAPDVRIVLSQNLSGKIDQTIQEISPLPSGNFTHEFKFPESIKNMELSKTLIVYCKQFFAHFGHGLIEFIQS